MAGLIKLVSLVAGSLLLLDTLHAIDLGSWGLGSDIKDHIDTALKGKELLAQVVDFLPGMGFGGAGSMVVEAVATTPGVVVATRRSLFSLVKFIISAAVVAFIFSFVFAYAKENQPAVEEFRAEVQQSVVPGNPLQTIVALTVRGTRSVTEYIQSSARSLPTGFNRPPSINMQSHPAWEPQTHPAFNPPGRGTGHHCLPLQRNC